MGIKKKKTFTQIVAVGHFLIFQKKKLQAYLVGLSEYCNILQCFTYSFEAEKQGEFLTRFGIDACFLGLIRCPRWIQLARGFSRE